VSNPSPAQSGVTARRTAPEIVRRMNCAAAARSAENRGLADREPRPARRCPRSGSEAMRLVRVCPPAPNRPLSLGVEMSRGVVVVPSRWR